MGNKKNKKKKKRKKSQRNTIVLQMFLHCKGGFMHDRREKRGGAKNKQKEIILENES